MESNKLQLGLHSCYDIILRHIALEINLLLRFSSLLLKMRRVELTFHTLLTVEWLTFTHL